MGFSDDFLTSTQSQSQSVSVSEAKHDLSSLANSPTKSISSQLSKTSSSQSIIVDNSTITTTTTSIDCVERKLMAIQEPVERQQPKTIVCVTRAEENCPEMVDRRRASLEKLLGMLYEDCRGRISSEADVTTDSSHFSDTSQRTTFTFTERQLQELDCESLKEHIQQMHNDVEYANTKLLKALKQRTHQAGRRATRCNIITAVLQAMSEKRRIDTKLQFSLDPPSTETGFQEWLNAMKAVARLPDGIPNYFRRKLWITLADHHINRMGIDWEQARKIAFSEKVTADDDRLGYQIIKDLHRTGWSGICGEAERIHLKRVLLGYARFNKSIGYCQGFNVIAALVLEVTEFKEESALKIMIFLIEQVLPQGYFDQSLRALSVDMAVLRSLLHQRLPKTAQHLDELQRNSGENEPPLTNVFSMHWFLTLFATCLPQNCVYRLWDVLILEGSEVLLRTSLTIWAKLSKKILHTTSTDHFYTVMGTLCQKLTQMRQSEIDNFISIVYSMSEFPYPGIAELRNRFAWNVESHPSAFTLFQKQLSSILHFTDDDASDSEHASCVNCSSDGKTQWNANASDMAALQKQYKLLRQRQKQAAIIFRAACEQNQNRMENSMTQRLLQSNKTNHFNQFNDTENASEIMFNHLYLSAMLVGFRKKDQRLDPPMYATMNGAVPVTSTIIQPINNDSLRSSIGYVGKEFLHNHYGTVALEYKQQCNEKSKVGQLAVNTCTLVTPQMSISNLDKREEDFDYESSTSEIEFDDGEVFLHQFIKSDHNGLSTRSDGYRKKSAPARTVTMQDVDHDEMKTITTRRSISCTSNYEGCRTKPSSITNEKNNNEQHHHQEQQQQQQQQQQCAIDATQNDTETSSDIIPLKMTLFVANNEKPQIHMKKSSIDAITDKNHFSISALTIQNGMTSSTLRKNAMTRRSLAILEKLTKQATPMPNPQPNPFPVVHKTFQASSSTETLN